MTYYPEQDAVVLSGRQLHKYGSWNIAHFHKGIKYTGRGFQDTIIVFVIKGGVLVSINGTKCGVVDTLHMFLVPPSSDFCIEPTKGSFVIMCCIAAEVLLSDYYPTDELLPLCENTNGEFRVLPVHYVICELFTLLRTYLRRGIESHSIFELKQRELLLLLFACYGRQELAEFLSPVIGKDIRFKDFVMNNYAKAKNVQELAAMANYSTSGFIKKFKRHFNESPYHWMQRQKARLIFSEITQGTTSLKEISIKYNFSSYSHFIDFCKSHYGCIPSKVSNQVRTALSEALN